MRISYHFQNNDFKWVYKGWSHMSDHFSVKLLNDVLILIKLLNDIKIRK
jgi:hypothetical protein